MRYNTQDLKRVRFSSSILYNACTALEILTPMFPQSQFLLAATAANVGKSVGITCSISTQPSFFKSFATNENLADIAAKQHAQTVVADTLGLAIAIAMSGACGANAAARRLLPMLAFPPLAAIDLFAIHREMRAVELKTLNRNRAEIAAKSFVDSRHVPTPKQMTELEGVFGDERTKRARQQLSVMDSTMPSSSPSSPSSREYAHSTRRPMLRLRIMPLGKMDLTDCEWDELANDLTDDAKYVLRYQPPRDWSLGGKLPALAHVVGRTTEPIGSLGLAMSDAATPEDILAGILHAEHFRRLTGDGADVSASNEAMRDARKRSNDSLDEFMSSLRANGYQLTPFLLSGGERSRYRISQQPSPSLVPSTSPATPSPIKHVAAVSVTVSETT